MTFDHKGQKDWHQERRDTDRDTDNRGEESAQPNGKAKSKANGKHVVGDQNADAAVLIKMNTDYAVVNVSGRARVVYWDGDRYQFSTFKDFQFLTDKILKEDGNKKIGIGKWWLKQPGRRNRICCKASASVAPRMNRLPHFSH